MPQLQQSPSQRLSRLEGFIEALETARGEGGFQNSTILDLSGFPGQVTIVGDLHGQAHNLRRALNYGRTWEKILRGQAMLLLLGDLIHEEIPERLAEMDRSLQLLEWVMELKSLAPHHVHILLGNHDLLYSERRKGRMLGNKVDQSQAYLDYLHHELGASVGPYLQRYSDYLKLCPLVCRAQAFASAHAGPIRRATLEEIRQTPIVDGPLNLQPRILQEAIYSRWHTKLPEDGYHGQDVDSFLAVCQCPQGHLVVGHSKFPGDTAWHWDLSANHHVLTGVKDFFGLAWATPDGVSYHSVGQAPDSEPDYDHELYDPGAAGHRRAVRGYLVESFGKSRCLVVPGGSLIPYDHEAWVPCSNRIDLRPLKLQQMLAGIPLPNLTQELALSDSILRTAPVRPIYSAVEISDESVALGRIGDKRFLWLA